jgi:hypothetical protein
MLSIDCKDLNTNPNIHLVKSLDIATITHMLITPSVKCNATHSRDCHVIFLI